MTTMRLSMFGMLAALATAASGAQAQSPQFRVPGQVHAVTDEAARTVTLFVEPDTPVAELVPAISVPDGYAVIPSSSEAQDFSQTVTYRVQGEGHSRQWEVNVLIKDRRPVLDFDGEQARIDTGLDIFEHLADSDAFSLSLWFYPRDRDRRQHVISQGARFRIDYRADRDRLDFRFALEENATRTVSANVDDIRFDRWNHLVISSQTPGITSLYLNGREVAGRSTDVAYGSPGDGGALVIGAHSSITRHFDGRLRDLRVYLGRALDEDEVQALHRGVHVQPERLFVHWPLDEGEGEVAFEASGTGHDGAIISAAWRDTVRVLKPCGEPSVAGLLALLTDMSDWPRFVATAEALREAGWEPDDDSYAARYWIAVGNWRACGELGEVAADPLADALRSGPESVRAEAAQLLGNIDGSAPRQALLAAAKDDSPQVRQTVGGALGRSGDPEALEGLLGLLQDGDRGVRRAAVASLAQLGDAAAGDLVEHLQKADDATVRSAAAAALGRMGTRKAVPALRAALADGAPQVRGSVADALGAIMAGHGARGEDDVVDVVAELTRLLDDAALRGRAATALGRIGGSQARAALVEGGYPDHWPTWRYDAARTASTPHELPDRLQLAWQRQLPTPKRAWAPQEDDSDKLAFDVSYQPVASDGLLYVPSMVRDRVTAYDAASGEEVWRFYTDGPVRFAPTSYKGRLYFVSDDGYLYCVDARDGALQWKKRGGPPPRRLLGNERLIDTWPARGAPVIEEGIVYFAAGIWPSMGIFLHAVDAVRGDAVWTSSGSGAHFIPQIHQSGGSHSGPAPQGYLATAGDMLLVPSGRSRPAAFRRSTGEFLYFNLVPRPWDRYPGMGGYAIMIAGDYFHVHGEVNRLTDGEPLLQVRTPHLEVLSVEDRLENRRAMRSIDVLPPGNISVANERELVGARHGRIAAYARQLEEKRILVTDRRGNQEMADRHLLQELWAVTTEPPMQQVFLQAGSRLYGSGPEGAILAVDHPAGDVDQAAPVQVTQVGTVEGEPWTMLAAEGRLFVVTEEGRIYCFAGEPGSGAVHEEPAIGLRERSGDSAEWASAIVRSGAARDGYAIVVGSGSEKLLEELLRQTNLHIIALAHDPEKVAHLRRHFDDAGVYGSRVAIHAGDPLTAALPPYLAELIVVKNLPAKADSAKRLLRHVFTSLRPYGGTAYLPAPRGRDERRSLSEWVEAADLANARLTLHDDHVTLTRAGPLPGAGEWTHQNADSANTLFSPESRVRAPLGVLWFGGPTNENVLPRHGRGPTPQVAGGRLFILGPDTLGARDVYSGRVLWEKTLPGIGAPYNTTSHQPGVDHVGSPYVSMADAVYVRHQGSILKLDPASGTVVQQFHPGGEPGEEEPAPLGYIGVWEDLLIAGVEAQYFDDSRPGHRTSWNATSSRHLVVMNRRTGERLWQREAEHGFRHNAIATAAGKVFLVDRLSDGVLDLLARRGRQVEGSPRLMALDAHTGDVLWSTQQNVFGSWLGYSAEHDVLLQAARPPVDGRQALPDEPRPATRLSAFRGRDGELLWQQDFSYRNACIIHGDKIIVHGDIYSLLTGEPYPQTHPVTGEQVPWTYAASSNCGQIIAGEHLLTFRRGTASYYDLANVGGTGDISGFRAGCTPNLVPADGVLSVPDYTRTCVCQYQLQTSLALVHMADAEQWVVDALEPAGAPVQRIGKNFGARGHRIDDRSGTLWMAYPEINRVGGTSEEVPLREQGQRVGSGTAEQIAVQVTPENPGWSRFYQHASLFDGQKPAWVVASGIVGVDSVELALAEDGEPRRYTVRLYFAEPGSAAEGERVFDVLLQGEAVLQDLDIAAAAGGPRQGLVREFTGVEVRDRLRVEFRTAMNAEHPPVLGGIEVIQQ